MSNSSDTSQIIRQPLFKAEQLTIRKATWLVQQRFPFVTTRDVATMANELTMMIEDMNGTLTVSEKAAAPAAQDIADFVCDIVADI